MCYLLNPKESQNLIKNYEVKPENASYNYNMLSSNSKYTFTKRKGNEIMTNTNSIFDIKDLLNLVPKISGAKFFIGYGDNQFIVGYKGKRSRFNEHRNESLIKCLYEFLKSVLQKRKNTVEDIIEFLKDPNSEINKDIVGKFFNVFNLTESIYNGLFEVINNTLLLPNPVPRLIKLKECGVLKCFCPNLDKLSEIEQGPQHFGTVWEHTLSVIKRTKPTRIQRWAALFHDSGKVQVFSRDTNEKIHFINHELFSEQLIDIHLKNLVSPKELLAIETITRYHMLTKQWKDITPKNVYKLEYLLGNFFEDYLDVVHADNMSHSEQYCLPEQVNDIRELAKSLPYNLRGYKLLIEGHEDKKDWLMKFVFSKPNITREELLHNIKTQYQK